MSESETPIYDALAENLKGQVPVALATIVEGTNLGAKLLVRENEVLGTLGDLNLDEVVAADALGHLKSGKSGVFHYGEKGERRDTVLTVFIESFAEPPTMVIFGAVDFTAALARLAGLLGFNVVVCDARSVFATSQRFPMANEIMVAWPDELFDKYGESLDFKDAVCILTHDPKFDVPAILRALKTDVGYIGVMGSRKTHSIRLERLVDAGASEAEIKRLMAPIGLDIGARTPEETALSILSEIVAVRSGHSGVSLKDSKGPIH